EAHPDPPLRHAPGVRTPEGRRAADGLHARRIRPPRPQLLPRRRAGASLTGERRLCVRPRIGYNRMAAKRQDERKGMLMITITEQAVAKVKELIEMQQKDGCGLRVYVAGGGCSGLRYGMMLEETPGEDDDTLDFSGLPVYMDPFSAQYLQGASVDYVETM